MNPIGHLRFATVGLVAAVLLSASAASASTVRVLLCFPGGPGSTEQAQPVVDEFLTHLSALAGWDGAKGTYYNNMRECRAAMKTDPAQVLMVPLDVYLAERTTWNLTAAASLQNKETAGSYHLVGKTGTTLESLKGQTVNTGLKASNAFLSRVAFDGKVDVDTAFTLERTRSARKAAKNVAKGKVPAAILNDVQFNALKSTKMGAGLESIVAGPALPGAIVANVGAVDGKLSGALTGVCAQHADACKKMRITGFAKVDAARLTALEKTLTK